MNLSIGHRLNLNSTKDFSLKDYYPFGMLMPERNFSIDNYRFGFNGKENNNEIEGIGNWQDYGMRDYNPRLSRFMKVDPIAKYFPMLSSYQYASNNPILNIDLDGLEGYQYIESIIQANGTTKLTRIIELDLYVATTKQAKNINYTSDDLSTIRSNLLNEYNGKGFKDSDGLDIEFRFNVKAFDADLINPSDFAKTLRKDPNNRLMAKEGFTTVFKGGVLERGKLKSGEQGSTNPSISKTTISIRADNFSHTIAHEIGHQFLNYNSDVNPVSVDEHKKVGGIFKYKVADTDGNTIEKIENVNQNNVDLFLKTLPEISERIVEPK